MTAAALRHRTQERRALAAVAALALAGLAAGGLYRLGVLPHPKKQNSDFGIRSVQSATDADGLDDQTDILQSARSYLAEKPRYQSRYYAGGWPDDGYGVCTDVVAFALRGAGYDLRELVNADIAAAPHAYGIAEPDGNIDYRRVRNLKIYFARHAAELTTDLSDIAAWQGGDIVLFRDHIAVVSDRRNALGIPYVLHLSGPGQLRYEEDILAFRSDLEGHYRFPGQL